MARTTSCGNPRPTRNRAARAKSFRDSGRAPKRVAKTRCANAVSSAKTSSTTLPINSFGNPRRIRSRWARTRPRPRRCSDSATPRAARLSSRKRSRMSRSRVSSTTSFAKPAALRRERISSVPRSRAASQRRARCRASLPSDGSDAGARSATVTNRVPCLEIVPSGIASRRETTQLQIEIARIGRIPQSLLA